MAAAGALGANPVTCFCHRRAASLRAPAPVLQGRSSLRGQLREDCRPHRSGAKRAAFSTFVAAVEDAPAAETDPSTSAPEEQQQEPDDFTGAIDFTNTDELYKRFNELLERQGREIKLNDKVMGTVAR